MQRTHHLAQHDGGLDGPSTEQEEDELSAFGKVVQATLATAAEPVFERIDPALAGDHHLRLLAANQEDFQSAGVREDFLLEFVNLAPNDELLDASAKPEVSGLGAAPLDHIKRPNCPFQTILRIHHA
jgi:hypothetical protein